MDDGGSEPNVCVARCSVECQTGHANPLAPERLPAVLALEIQADGKTLPKDRRQLIREMAAENATWGEDRIANELKLKLGIRVSPRTVGKYLRTRRPVRTPDPKQRWLSFVP
jgi:hypothetical protein